MVRDSVDLLELLVKLELVGVDIRDDQVFLLLMKLLLGVGLRRGTGLVRVEGVVGGMQLLDEHVLWEQRVFLLMNIFVKLHV